MDTRATTHGRIRCDWTHRGVPNYEKVRASSCHSEVIVWEILELREKRKDVQKQGCPKPPSGAPSYSRSIQILTDFGASNPREHTEDISARGS